MLRELDQNIAEYGGQPLSVVEAPRPLAAQPETSSQKVPEKPVTITAPSINTDKVTALAAEPRKSATPQGASPQDQQDSGESADQPTADADEAGSDSSTPSKQEPAQKPADQEKEAAEAQPSADGTADAQKPARDENEPAKDAGK